MTTYPLIQILLADKSDPESRDVVDLVSGIPTGSVAEFFDIMRRHLIREGVDPARVSINDHDAVTCGAVHIAEAAYVCARKVESIARRIDGQERAA